MVTKKQYFKERINRYVNEVMIFCTYLDVNDVLIF